MKPSIRHVVAVMLGMVVMVAFGACTREKGTADSETVYTCPMHPSVRMRDPKAKCPICGMNLVPAQKVGSGTMSINTSNGPTAFSVSTTRQQQIGVTYVAVEKRALSKTIRTVGTVTADRQRRWDFVSRVEGYVQKLHIASAGERVERNQALVTLYSAELLTTEREFLDLLRSRDKARESGSQPAIESAERRIESAKVRLRLWNVGEPQLEELEKTRQLNETLTLYSPFRGVVQNLGVDQGRRVMAGDDLVSIADLSVVWVWAEFFQEEIPLLHNGMPVAITASAFPGETFKATIQLINPFIEPDKRTARARIQVDNPDLKLRPEMYVDAQVQINLGESLAIPESAVMPTGKRNFVFVDRGEGRLEPRAVELGGKAEGFYAIVSGVAAGERVVNSANFLIDAEAEIQGALKAW